MVLTNHNLILPQKFKNFKRPDVFSASSFKSNKPLPCYKKGLRSIKKEERKKPNLPLPEINMFQLAASFD